MKEARNGVNGVWDELLAVRYFSPSPSTQFGFHIPKPPRADTDPYLNNEPWYNGSTAFADIDQTWKSLKGDHK